MNMYQFNEKNILDTLSVNKEDPEECLKIIAQFKDCLLYTSDAADE